MRDDEDVVQSKNGASSTACKIQADKNSEVMHACMPDGHVDESDQAAFIMCGPI